MAAQPQDILAQMQAVVAAWADKKPGTREKLMNLGHALISSLELPSEPARAASCRIAAELNLFEYLKESGTEGISASDLSTKTGADHVLIVRIMRHLVAMNMVGENGPEIYIATPLSNTLAEPKFSDSIIFTHDVLSPGFHNLPTFFRQLNHTLPADLGLTNAPFQFAHKTSLALGGGMGHDLLKLHNAPWNLTAMDHLMFVIAASRERTEADWNNIARRAGFKIIYISTYEVGTESFIEAELVSNVVVYQEMISSSVSL
ncbi:hypothetical protein B0T17DRAFT_508960 [Bombardia bombarda]|uniref:O-methyltransferase dimerisation domain-containing protein n=1 Tax=Bombardia bombarda TaxID=252184 RepID=A0AA39WU64_9PEZI|nr:hypothetical protein B0T17DRAFT_508960 [Bombardia bombarda]